MSYSINHRFSPCRKNNVVLDLVHYVLVISKLYWIVAKGWRLQREQHELKAPQERERRGD